MSKKQKISQTLSSMLTEKSICYTTDGKVVTPCITEEFDMSKQVWHIEALVKELLQSPETLFRVEAGKPITTKYLVAKPLGKQIINVLKFDFDNMIAHFPFHEFNPYVELFHRNMKFNQLDEKVAHRTPADLHELEAELNAFVAAIRHDAQSPSFKKTLGEFRRLSNKNHASFVAYINALFDAYARLVILRIDLGYRKATDWPNGIHGSIRYADVKGHQKELLKYLRTKLPNKPMVGYAWCLEYGLDKGWHQHLMVFLDGSKVREDITIAQIIGEAWNGPITEGQGLFYNCNANKESYRSCGIGTINHYDTAAREGLEKAAAYMTKPDYYLALVLPDGGRAFGKGVAPKPDSHKGGRPRKTPLAHGSCEISLACEVPPVLVPRVF